ncbi:MAG: hypothetical protein A2845_05030 [Candidatus Lloydbacteria bacterium RIFCSPHIGHO2_01_FULL_49_22]|uniref:Dockerin domain-containing protein n=1 Tax=Candidatus Lloydbacteria bacterium RIFCSPHIGHO2_01_FULL_49_22 TaxID=1798658 RepID=A0A1G2CTZ3_9BACT|nr:MAG: hypothetical protein A2845_05030 [Candidatus Lloydbacteria bacterium RIFCSPHIGHO2_01_FULL_49_22]OGZ09491.1 MAG: hypothetical protein A3C14_01585 [Candidatus Lloydbacteria bacterium RIFCSPHIGHO2_02_FULL_50_18]
MRQFSLHHFNQQRRYVRSLALGVSAAFFFFISTPFAYAGTLSFVSDTISNSAPGATTTSHVIQFTATTAIPPSGHIVISPTEGFIIPAALSFLDIDLSVAGTSSGPFTNRTLAATPSAANIGVAVTSGASGQIVFSLASGAGILAGDTVKITIGDIATFGGVGTLSIENPASVGSRHLRLLTTNVLNGELDFGSTVVVIILPVGISVELPIFEPTRSNGLPSGLLPGTTQNVWLSLNTDIPATCRYATTSGVLYTNMLGSTSFTAANFGSLHYRSEAVATNTIYSFYVRCQTPSLVANSDDMLIYFEVGVEPGASSTPPLPPPPPPASPGGGGISGPGGGGGLFMNGGDVTLEGKAAPLSAFVILKDGVIVREGTVSQSGDFSEKFTDLQRGTYTWGVYVRDEKGRLSSTYSSTIYLIARTNNIIAPVYVSPTITAASTTIGVGDTIRLSGYGAPLVPVLAIMNMQGNALSGKIVTGTTTANGNGSWSMTLPTDGLLKGTFEVKALSQISKKDQSLLSPIVYIGIGGSPNPDFSNRSDLNKDKKVNLIDFSILLFNWKGADPVSDINQDGTVNLVDFSIMLANWTG